MVNKLNLDKQKAFFGLDFQRVEDDKVIVTQIDLPTGRILTQKELIERGKAIFPDCKIVPNVFSLDTDKIDLEWIKNKMEENGLKANDLIKHLAFNKAELSKILNGHTALSKKVKAALFFYFLSFEQQRSFSDFERLSL